MTAPDALAAPPMAPGCRPVPALARAYDLAARAHGTQVRRGAVRLPYLVHLCEVAALVAETLGEGDPEAVAAAVLHDTLEDTDLGSAAITAACGARVAEIVAELTDPPTFAALALDARKAAQAARMASASPAARAIKIADQTSNLRGLAEGGTGWSPARNRAYLAGARQVVAACRGPWPGLEAAFDAAARRLEAVLEQGEHR